jgi:hypothetical protein
MISTSLSSCCFPSLSLFTQLRRARSTPLLANLREQAQEDQLDDTHYQMLIDERVREQVQRVFDIASHERNVICRKVLGAHIRRHNLYDDSCALAPDGQDFVIRGWHARRAERVIWEDGTTNGL